MNISKLLKKYDYTRSPYIFYDDGMPSMYFTVYEDGRWQLYFTDNKEVQKVDFLQDNSIENVTCFKNQTGAYCVSFCSKMSEANSLFYTETPNPALFKIITSFAHKIKTGAVTPSKVIIIDLKNHLLVYLKKDEIILDELTPILDMLFDFNDPTHISFTNNDLNQLIISYRDVLLPLRHGTLYVNLNNLNDQKQILTEDSLPIYDVTIDPYTNEVLYSEHIGLKKFQRKIAKTFVKNIISNQVTMLK